MEFFKVLVTLLAVLLLTVGISAAANDDSGDSGSDDDSGDSGSDDNSGEGDDSGNNCNGDDSSDDTDSDVTLPKSQLSLDSFTLACQAKHPNMNVTAIQHDLCRVRCAQLIVYYDNSTNLQYTVTIPIGNLISLPDGSPCSSEAQCVAGVCYKSNTVDQCKSLLAEVPLLSIKANVCSVICYGDSKKIIIKAPNGKICGFLAQCDDGLCKQFFFVKGRKH